MSAGRRLTDLKGLLSLLFQSRSRLYAALRLVGPYLIHIQPWKSFECSKGALHSMKSIGCYCFSNGILKVLNTIEAALRQRMFLETARLI